MSVRVGARNALRLSTMCSIGMYRGLRGGARDGGARSAPRLCNLFHYKDRNLLKEVFPDLYPLGCPVQNFYLFYFFPLN